jgi:PAS domain S-box-containing protein
MDDTLRRAALAVSAAEGGEVYDRLAAELADILGVAIAFVAVFADPARTQMRMLAFRLDGKLRTPFTYPLAGTPCAMVVGSQFRCVPSDARREFPRDDLFARLGLESYAAYPLNDAAGAPLGLIGAMDRKPLRDVALCEAILKIFAMRAAAELEHGARQDADEALRASEGRYRAIFNAAADSMVLRDADFRVVDVNPAYEKMSGRPRAEALGRNDLTMSPPELTEHVRGLHARALAGEPVMFEARARRKNGERFDIETRGVPIEHEGRPHVLYIGRDITARKSAEQMLRTSEEQYRAIFNAATDALVLRDADFRIVDVNPAYEALSGYARDEVIGLDRVVANPPETEAHMRALHQKALGGETVMVEAVRVSKNGKRRDVELRGVPIQYRGKPHVLYIGRDISERKRAEERLRASEEQYRAIFNAAADALVLRDSEARIVDVNPASLEMSGYTRDEVINSNRWVFANPEQAGLAREMFRRVIGGESVHFEVEGRRKDGSRLLVEMRAVPIVYRGRPHALGMARDITERKALESRLRQAQRMEALGHLTGGVAHDFNNLLAAIMGYIVLASERETTTTDAKLPEYLEKALASCRQARDLIQQMLTFSRGQRGSPQPLALAETVAESLKLLRSSLPSSLELGTRLAPVPAVMLDPVQLDQILLNLCINARDAMAGIGRVDVAVRTTALRGKAVCASCRKRFRGEFAELEVADSGPGIAPHVVERMFEPFFTTKDVGRGSGMGLATVHGIVHEHGGHIIVEAAPGAGSRFRILCRCTRERAGGCPRGRRPAARPSCTGACWWSTRRPRPISCASCSRLGSRSHCRTNPLGVLERVARSAPTVILDHDARISGVNLAREIAAARPGLPVVLYTGNSDRLDRQELSAAGVLALLQKPVEPAALYETLSAHLH